MSETNVENRASVNNISSKEGQELQTDFWREI